MRVFPLLACFALLTGCCGTLVGGLTRGEGAPLAARGAALRVVADDATPADAGCALRRALRRAGYRDVPASDGGTAVAGTLRLRAVHRWELNEWSQIGSGSFEIITVDCDAADRITHQAVCSEPPGTPHGPLRSDPYSWSEDYRLRLEWQAAAASSATIVTVDSGGPSLRCAGIATWRVLAGKAMAALRRDWHGERVLRVAVPRRSACTQ